MKIIKTKLKEEKIAAYTDEYPEIGFYIPLDDLKDQKDLIAKVQIRVDKEREKREKQKSREQRYNNLKV
jgi:hypothetical protein|tara:strand:- start:1051 stop:1257 length:207 start_codon:yes stop_codon:yes gene_type:complete